MLCFRKRQFFFKHVEAEADTDLREVRGDFGGESWRIVKDWSGEESWSPNLDLILLVGVKGFNYKSFWILNIRRKRQAKESQLSWYRGLSDKMVR